MNRTPQRQRRNMTPKRMRLIRQEAEEGDEEAQSVLRRME